jgi:hypothetical protein
MQPARRRPFLREDHLDVLEPRRVAVDEARTRHGGLTAAAGRNGEAEIDRAVLGEAAIEDHVMQAALIAREHGRHAGNRRRKLSIPRNDAQPAGALGDQHAAVRQKRDRPGVGQARSGGFDRQLVGCRTIRPQCRLGQCGKNAGGKNRGGRNGKSHEILLGRRMDVQPVTYAPPGRIPTSHTRLNTGKLLGKAPRPFPWGRRP